MKRVRQTIICALTAMLPMSIMAAPIGYAVNSDSGTANADSLYRIDLASGVDTVAGKILSLATLKRDTEGLAFAPDGTLYGIDDESLTLFPISMAAGIVDHTKEVNISDINSSGGNDFGLTFTCSGDLFVTSVVSKSLHRLNLDGSSSLVGAEGALGAKISAIAAYGNPARLFGLGNGEDIDGGSVRQLYEIDMNNGTATVIGSLGGQPGDYTEAGLSFDSDGNLWAITDRRVINQNEVNLPSQILLIDPDTGTATVVSETSEIGFESLAVAPPAGCRSGPQKPVSPGVYEPIPTLSPVGLIFASLVLLLAGLAALRRFTF